MSRSWLWLVPPGILAAGVIWGSGCGSGPASAGAREGAVTSAQPATAPASKASDTVAPVAKPAETKPAATKPAATKPAKSGPKTKPPAADVAKAETKVKPPRKAPPPKVEAAKAAEPKPDEFEEMITMFKLQGPQLEQMRSKMKARTEALAAWDQTEKGKQKKQQDEELAQAKAGDDAAKLQAAQEKAKPLADEHWELRKKLRADVMSVLTLEQQRAWAGHMLWGPRKLFQSFRRAGLTEEQTQKAIAVCAEVAAEVVKEGTVAKDPYLMVLNEVKEKAFSAVKDKVLTDEQRAQAATPAQKAPAEKKE
jgi:hypothetical protein